MMNFALFPWSLTIRAAPQKYLESFDGMETAHRANDEIVLIESELFAEARRVRRHANPIDVDGVVDACYLVDPETLDEKVLQGKETARSRSTAQRLTMPSSTP